MTGNVRELRQPCQCCEGRRQIWNWIRGEFVPCPACTGRDHQPAKAGRMKKPGNPTPKPAGKKHPWRKPVLPEKVK